MKLGALLIHAPMSEHPFEAGEQGFWTAVGLFLGISLRLRALGKIAPAAVAVAGR